MEYQKAVGNQFREHAMIKSIVHDSEPGSKEEKKRRE
jgi:hypothetical protein